MNNKDIKKLEDLGWERMRLQLDEEMPQEKKKRRALIWWFSAACVGMIAISTYFISLPNVTQDQTLFAKIAVDDAVMEAVKNDIASSSKTGVEETEIVEASTSVPSVLPSIKQPEVLPIQNQLRIVSLNPKKVKATYSNIETEKGNMDINNYPLMSESKNNKSADIQLVINDEDDNIDYSTTPAKQDETTIAPKSSQFQVSNIVFPKVSESSANGFISAKSSNEKSTLSTDLTKEFEEKADINSASEVPVNTIPEEMPSPIQPNKIKRIQHELGLSTWAALGNQSEKYGINYGINFLVNPRFSVGLLGGYLYENSIITKVDGQYQQVSGNAFTTLVKSSLVKTQVHHNISLEAVSAFYLIPKKFFLSGTLGYIKPLSPRKELAAMADVTVGTTTTTNGNAIDADMGNKNEIHTARFSPSLGIGYDLKHFTLTTRYRQVSNVYDEWDRFIDFNLKYRF